MEKSTDYKSGWLGRWIAARHMALAGYITKIIMIETGLTYKQVRRLYQDIENDGYELERRSRTFRGGATLIHSHTSKIQASLLMQLYRNIGGEDVIRSIDIKALNKAFRMYHAIRKEVPGMKGARWTPFDITDAWCLASELRCGDAMLEQCDNCECTYFTSVNQRTCVECPFCVADKSKAA
ncbi:regulator [Salmonella enterica]|nr:regulator [Salmonella enterica subsp. enterica serovar Mbandaka]EEP7171218.1 regulator [Salmonella enterica]ELB1035173.1 regulator [Proteus mirabilis]EEP7172450.1 regulator [Salmonella enterica]EFS6066841.1 regulator [Salmonella enterica subsp. enterica serovar Mbandaka]